MFLSCACFHEKPILLSVFLFASHLHILCFITLLEGDAWSVPVAGAVLFTLVACLIPTKINDGKPAKPLQNPPQGSLLRLADLVAACESDWSCVFASSGPNSAGDAVVSGQQLTEDDSSQEPPDFATAITWVKTDELFKCDVCDGHFGRGMCRVAWVCPGNMAQLHFECVLKYAAQNDLSEKLITGLQANKASIHPTLRRKIDTLCTWLAYQIPLDSGVAPTTTLEPEEELVEVEVEVLDDSQPPEMLNDSQPPENNDDIEIHVVEDSQPIAPELAAERPSLPLADSLASA